MLGKQWWAKTRVLPLFKDYWISVKCKQNWVQLDLHNFEILYGAFWCQFAAWEQAKWHLKIISNDLGINLNRLHLPSQWPIPYSLPINSSLPSPQQLTLIRRRLSEEVIRRDRKPASKTSHAVWGCLISHQIILPYGLLVSCDLETLCHLHWKIHRYIWLFLDTWDMI